MTEAPIGVFDSGIGGLSVYLEMRRLLNGGRIIYVADQGFGMYGERSLDVVRRRSEQVSGRLIDAGASAVVVACNSASAAALDHLRRRWPDTPFVGMEPAVKPAALLTAGDTTAGGTTAGGVTRGGTIGVMATKATFQGELFASVVDRFAGDHQVVATACPGLAEAVEDDAAGIDDLIDEYVGRTLARGAEVLVLGCTHYSLIRDRIIACAGDVPVIDPAPAVARQAQRIVEPRVGGPDSFLTTGDTGRFAIQIDRLGLDPARVGSFAV